MYYRELTGLADQFAAAGHPEINVTFLCAWAYIHELAHADFNGTSAPTAKDPESHGSSFLEFRDCTGVLAADYDGKVFHGRNMDKNIPGARNLTLRLTFTKSSQVVAVAVDYYWFNVGFVTGYKSGVVSLSENWRKQYRDYDGNAILHDIYLGTMAQVWLFREALLNHYMNYDQILQFLISSFVAAPMYAIIAGNQSWEGAVVSKEPQTQLPIYYLNKTSPNGWFLVQTNYDMWVPDPQDDPRRTVAELTLRQMT